MTEIEQVRADKLTAQAECESIGQSLVSTAGEITQTETDLATLREEYATLESELAAAENRLEYLKGRLEELSKVPTIAPIPLVSYKVGGSINLFLTTDVPATEFKVYPTRDGSYIPTSESGVSMDLATGAITGVANKAGTYKLSVTARNLNGWGPSYGVRFSVVATSAPAPAPAPNPPAPTPPAPSPPAPSPEWPVSTSIVVGPAPDSYRVWSNKGIKNGASCLYFNDGLKLRWRNLNGDYTDADGVPMGFKPWYSITVDRNAAGYLDTDITTLVKKWQTDANRGLFMIPYPGNDSWSRVTLGGTFSLNPPVLDVVLEDGTQQTLKGDLCSFTTVKATAASAPSAVDCSLSALLGSTSRAVLHFHDVLKLASPIKSATLRLYVVSSSTRAETRVEIYETDPPPLLLGGAGLEPEYGIAMEVGEEDLSSHPDVIKAGDMREENWNATPGVWKDSSLGAGKLFSSTSMSKAQWQKSKVVPDPDHPGRFALRTCIAEGQIGGGEFIHGWHRSGPASTGRMPDPAGYEPEVYSRVEIYLEPDSFWSRLYAFKFSPVGMNLRYGKGEEGGGWNGDSIWIFGSGQTPSDGRRHWNEEYKQWILKGHSIRGHMLGQVHPDYGYNPGAIALGIAPSHLGPYDTLRNGGLYGTEQNLRVGKPHKDHCIPMGRWVTIESRCRINTVDMSYTDEWGNGEARNDGIWEMRMDGALVGGLYDMAWVRHPSMGIKGTWTMAYHGGNTPTDHDIYFWLRNPAVARRMIGPARTIVF